MKNILKKGVLLGISLILAGCASSTAEKKDSTSDSNSLTIIATANPHEIILNQAKIILKEKYDIDLQITVTDDYYTPNEAVSNGDADANFFQHVPFFTNEKETNGYQISNVAGIHIEPFGFYSKSIKDINELGDGSTVVISNSVADNGRILTILEKAGLVTLKDGVSATTATLGDIVENKKNLQFKEVKPELLVTAFENGEGDIVAINGNYAIQGGLVPSKDAVLLEQADATNPYVNILVCHEGNENDEKIKTLVEVLQSEEIKNFITQNWADGSVIPAN